MFILILPQASARKGRLTFHALLAALFAAKLRETLDLSTGGDRSDAAWAWGL